MLVYLSNININMQKQYTEKQFDLNHVQGLSSEQLNAHLGLYAGYVKNTNLLIEKLDKLKNEEHGPELAEISRRFGFEFNGMRLHEYYFEQFTSNNEDELPVESLKKALAEQFGSFEAWEADFKRTGMLRGAGWTLLVEDEDNGNLFNIWVNDHELGHLGSQKVLLAMDVWEHAYLVDYLPSQRKEYIDIFFQNLNWSIVENRFQK